MTNEEAFREVLHQVYRNTDDFEMRISKECYKKIITALEKQIPKKPRASFQSGFFWCPSCERAIKRSIEDSKINISYCPFCGRALDWSDTNG